MQKTCLLHRVESQVPPYFPARTQTSDPHVKQEIIDSESHRLATSSAIHENCVV